MSATANRGSNAPYTVVPAVALTRKGTNPYANEKAPNNVNQQSKDSFKKLIFKRWTFSSYLTHLSFWNHQKGFGDILEPSRNDVHPPDLSSPGHSIGSTSCLMRTDTLVLRRGCTGPGGWVNLVVPQNLWYIPRKVSGLPPHPPTHPLSFLVFLPHSS